MTKEQAQKVLDELQGVRPEMLNGEAKRLFEAIIEIADERDNLYLEIQEKERLINTLVDYIAKEDIDEEVCKHIKCVDNEEEMNCAECVKNFFINKIKQEEEIKKDEY